MITSGELLTALRKRGVNISQQTLSNWVRDGRITRGHRGTAPGGRGQTAYYPTDAIDEAFAVWHSLHPTKIAVSLKKPFDAVLLLDLIEYHLRAFGNFDDCAENCYALAQQITEKTCWPGSTTVAA